MGIYAHKIAGRATGRQRVEVMRDGVRTVRYTDTLKEARKVEAMLKLGQLPDSEGKPVVYDAGNLWEDCYGLWDGHKDEKQSVKRFRVVCNCLKDALGNTPLAAIEVKHLDMVKSLLMAKEGRRSVASGSTINRYLATLSKALNWADARRKLRHLPRFDTIWERVQAPPMFELSEDTERRLREALQAQRGDDYVLLMDVQIATGSRISELLSLTPEDITRHTQGNETWCELNFRDTKNGEARITPIEVELGEPFKALVVQGLPSYRAVWRAMRYARKTAGLPTTQPTHAHRHTTATRLTQRGVPTAEVMQFLGHKSINTTMRYIKVDTRSKRRTMAVLSNQGDHT